MADVINIAADVRETFGKGASRQLRRDGKIPAVIYGHGTDPRHVALPGHETMLAVRRANAILTLDIAGDDQLVLVKDVQRDPVRQIIEHVDLLVIKKGEKVEVEVPIVLEGEVQIGYVANQALNTLTVKVDATNIPEHVLIDVDGLGEGATVTVADLKLPEGAEVEVDPEEVVVSVTIVAEEPEADETAEAAEGDADAAADDAPAEEAAE